MKNIRCNGREALYFKLQRHWMKICKLSSFLLLAGMTSAYAEDAYSINRQLEVVNERIHSAKSEEVTQATVTVSGIVKDNTGEPLIGVSVLVKGTTTGVITDLDGRFTLQAPAGSELLISYIGYANQSIPVTSRSTNLNIILQSDEIALDEVVVTALGINRSQKALSYNVQEVKGDELLGVKDANFMNSLSGKVAGVTINASSAGMGGATRVVMRGTKSITKDNNALYVIDGIPIFNSNKGELGEMNEYASHTRSEGIADLNPEDIESISVLTGPAAAALYGSNAANGAILITTKKGVTGKPKVIVSSQTSFSKPFVLPEFQNRYGNRSGEYRSWGDKQSQYNYNPSDFFNTGVATINSASLSVGSDKNQTYFSIGSTNSKGIIPENRYDKYNVSLRNSTKFLQDKMTLDFGFSYIKQSDKNMLAQGKYYNLLTAIYTYPRGENPATMKAYEKYSDAEGYPVQQWQWG
ncbi:MAG: SusC/RagA family TonB-linked outer membrane protein [Tannerellaceae bacterium]|nr:SusC/RagA family TonB-linked outer membrane protein [Tannerellaceae bacterium]